MTLQKVLKAIDNLSAEERDRVSDSDYFYSIYWNSPRLRLDRFGGDMNTSLIRPIKTDADYELALQRASELMSAEPNTPAADELEVLATLIELYEDKHFPIELPDLIAAIEFRLEQLDRW